MSIFFLRLLPTCRICCGAYLSYLNIASRYPSIIIECLHRDGVSNPHAATTLTSREGPGVDSGMRVREWVEIPSTNIIDIPSSTYMDQTASGNGHIHIVRYIVSILYEIKHYIIVDLWGGRETGGGWVNDVAIGVHSSFTSALFWWGCYNVCIA